MADPAPDNSSPPAAAPKSVLVFFSSPEISELLRFSLESRFHCTVTAFKSAADTVISFKGSHYDLAVLDHSAADGMLVFEQVQGAKIPFVLHHPEGISPEVRGPKIKAYKEAELLPAVLKALAEIQATPKTAEGEPGRPPFTPMSLALLRKVNPQATDLFIRLSALKFVKVISAGDPFTAEDEEKYQRKKVPGLFLRNDSVDRTVAKVNALLEAMLKVKRPRAEAKPIAVDSVAVMHELVKQVGFTPEVQKLVKNSMNLVVKEMQDSPSLSVVLKTMELNKEKYIAAHSSMLAEVSCAVAIAMEWGSDMSLKKIAMAALLHDMCLDDQRLCAVKDMTELNERKAEFDLSMQEQYANHSKKAAVLIQGMKEVPADVDKIVYQHHELPRGTGFPEAIGHTHIHPLAACLMVSHDLVDWLIDNGGKVDMPAFIAAHDEKYQQGVYKKIMKAIKELKFGTE